jgi:Carboxypeptidase regulatory-like domain
MSPFGFSIVFTAILSLVSTALSQTPSRDNQQRTASISGRVTVSGQPAVNATITVTEAFPRSPRRNAGENDGAEPKEVVFFSVKTDESGRYQFTALPAGSYLMRAHSFAFIPENRAAGLDPFKRITLDRGEKRENVDFGLVPGGVITGRVSDADGRPLIAKRVKVFIVDEQEKKSEYAVGYIWHMFATDDRGVYRLYGLPPGRYLLSAGGDGDFSGFGGSAKKYQRTYHPDAREESRAKVIEIKEGEEVTDVDIRLGSAQKTYEAIGRVVAAETGQPIPHIPVVCAALDDKDQAEGDFGGFGTADSQGKFRITGLPSSRYLAYIYPRETATGEGEYYYGTTIFEILDSNLNGIEVKGNRGATLSGIVVLEGSNDSSFRAMPRQTVIQAFTIPDTGSHDSDSREISHRNLGLGPPPAKVGSDGSFHLSGLPPGRVNFHISSSNTTGLSILRVERNNVEMKDGIKVGPGETVTGVRLTVQHGRGVIRGQVKIEGGKLPEASRLNISVRNTVKEGYSLGFNEVDEKGNFIIEGLIPGEYEVSLKVTTILNPITGGVNESVEPGQQLVRVTDGSETKVTLTLDLNRRNQQRQQ